jgi:hypothetical protein
MGKIGDYHNFPGLSPDPLSWSENLYDVFIHSRGNDSIDIDSLSFSTSNCICFESELTMTFLHINECFVKNRTVIGNHVGRCWWLD